MQHPETCVVLCDRPNLATRLRLAQRLDGACSISYHPRRYDLMLRRFLWRFREAKGREDVHFISSMGIRSMINQAILLRHTARVAQWSVMQPSRTLIHSDKNMLKIAAWA